MNTDTFLLSHPGSFAFDMLKEALTQAPILAYSDFQLPFHLYVDVTALGQIQNGKEMAISNAGRKLLAAKRNSLTKQEALAVVTGIKYYLPYV